MQFLLHRNDGIALTKMGAGAKGIVLGPGLLGGPTLNAVLGVIHDDR